MNYTASSFPSNVTAVKIYSQGVEGGWMLVHPFAEEGEFFAQSVGMPADEFERILGWFREEAKPMAILFNLLYDYQYIGEPKRVEIA